jgi:asparagine synthase (glutamine-hydrolysing)
MPGLVGAVKRSPAQAATDVFRQLLGPMQRRGRLQTEVCIAPDDRWALGRLHLGTLQPAPQLVGGDTLTALFHGDLTNDAELRKTLQAEGLTQPGGGIIQLIAALYRFYGSRCACQLKGSFCAVILDETAKKLVLISDRLGSYPLYWCNGPDHFSFASELKSLLRDPALHPTLNPRAIADYLAFGFIFGDKTLAEQVRLLPAASTLTYCWEDGHCTLERYARLDTSFQPWEGTKAEYLVTLCEAFNDAVHRTLRGEHRFGISLSGGLDSRAILSAIDCAQTPIAAYTLGEQGCADEVIAKKLAQIAGATHYFDAIDSQYLEGFLPNLGQMVSLTDGMYLSHGLTEMLALQLLEKSDCSVLLRGHGGELAKASLAWPLHTDERIYAMQNKEEFVSYLLERLNYVGRQVALRELFSEDWWASLEGGARRSLEESIADVRLAPPDLCSYLYLEEAHRRFTIPSLELFRNLVEVRLPFVDEDFLAVLFRAPTCWRDGTDVHRAIIGANLPAFLNVRNSNTGAPVNAGPILEKILDRANSLFRRLNLYGYRHYHNFELWMKRQLVDSVEKVLLEPDSPTHKIYREDTLRRLIGETRHGAADHGYLLQILLIFELWQREHLRRGTH